jgi:aspartate/glutamate racemase
MLHLGILAHSTEGAALCFLTFCQEGNAALGPYAHPDVTMDCIALSRSMPSWDSGDYAPIRDTLRESIDRLARAGADFFVCPDNTAHMAMELPGEPFALPGLHIAQIVADQAARDRRTKVGVLGRRTPWMGLCIPMPLPQRGFGQSSRLPRTA